MAVFLNSEFKCWVLRRYLSKHANAFKFLCVAKVYPLSRGLPYTHIDFQPKQLLTNSHHFTLLIVTENCKHFWCTRLADLCKMILTILVLVLIIITNIDWPYCERTLKNKWLKFNAQFKLVSIAFCYKSILLLFWIII